jgi:hypothetical protein
VRQPQVGDQVVYLRHGEQVRLRTHLDRNAAPTESVGECARLGVGAEQHRGLASVRDLAAEDEAGDFVGHKAGLVQHVDARFRIVARECLQQRRVGAPERVDALGRIADDAEVPMSFDEPLHERVLDWARVLRFVDQHPAKGVLQHVQGARVRVEQAQRQELHGGVVDSSVRVQETFVGVAELGQQLLVEPVTIIVDSPRPAVA